MTITAEDIGKKYGRSWIFKHLNFTIDSNESVAIVGRNGSGKSTLLQIISGFLSPSRGKVLIDEKHDFEEHATYINFVSPAMQLPEEFTLEEFLDFHSAFKKPFIGKEEMAKSALLPLNKRMEDFSSGMKQRVKLISAFYFESTILLLDEPTSYLDEQGSDWYLEEIEKKRNHCTLVIASNQKKEYDFCSKLIDLNKN